MPVINQAHVLKAILPKLKPTPSAISRVENLKLNIENNFTRKENHEIVPVYSEGYIPDKINL